ncbi:unnamed protein product [Arctia plantaginis]|uniref:Uncharacterized protein n=1 Tax=Arctia plantaginis TaxID=874455 RepID=A0A8S1AXB6_ARCPL|nr:unnamed protein product [Arctia plantaginis]CAB3251348.1 unnamed protein product [Arctia plantaginis]
MVFFESATSKGFFVHNPDALLTITINRTNLNNLGFVFGQIAIFMTKGFEYTSAPTLKSIRMKISKLYSQSWWLLLGMREDIVRTVKREIEMGEGDVTMGALRFSDTIELEMPECEKCIIKDETLIGENSGQQICVAPFVREMVVLDFNIKTTNPPLYPITNRQLIKAIQYNLSNLGSIKKNVSLNQSSSVYYEKLKKFVPFSQQERASEFLKGLLHNKVVSPGQNDLFIAVFYNFVYGGKQKTSVMSMDKIFYSREELHFDLSNGIVKLSNDGCLYCDNELIVSVSNSMKDCDESVCAVLPALR